MGKENLKTLITNLAGPLGSDSMPKVSIIVLTYNSAVHITALIESICNQNNKEDFEIIVIDNKSLDDTVKKTKTLISKNKDKELILKLVENKNNAGFAAGINKGVKYAQGKYVLFINPDARWKKGKVSDMTKILEANPEVSIVGGRMVKNNGMVEKSAGKFFDLKSSFLIALGLDENLGIRFSPNKTSRVDFVSGGFMMVRRSAFEELGGFDENLFMYVEDMEFCYRAKKAGYKTYFCHDAEVEHESHGSGNRAFAIQNIIYGIIYFHKKHGNPFSYLAVKSLFLGKAMALVAAGKMINNKNLADTYSPILKK